MSAAKTTHSVQSGETRSSAVMAAGTLVSRFLGFAKTWMLGAALGLGSTVNDTFINANNLPNLIFLLVATNSLTQQILSSASPVQPAKPVEKRKVSASYIR